jgi:PKD repeat protein/sugar lactone lactonase YvrE
LKAIAFGSFEGMIRVKDKNSIGHQRFEPSKYFKKFLWLISPCIGLLFLLVLIPIASAESYSYVTQWGSQGSDTGQFGWLGPWGIAVDSLGNVYVTDSSMCRVQKFTSNGVYLTQWGMEGGEVLCTLMGEGHFMFPADILVNGSDYVYVTDIHAGNIQKFTSDGTYLTYWGGVSWPIGIAIDGSENVYVVDLYNNLTQKFTSSGTYLDQWGSFGSGNGQFNKPMGIAIDSLGNVYIVDRGNYRVQKFTSSGTYLDQWGSFGSGNGQFNYPKGIAIDSLGNVYVVDSNNHRVQKFTSSGTYLDQWGSYGTGNGQFNYPQDIAIDSLGNIYVSDSSNHRIQKFVSSVNPPKITQGLSQYQEPFKDIVFRRGQDSPAFEVESDQVPNTQIIINITRKGTKIARIPTRINPANKKYTGVLHWASGPWTTIPDQIPVGVYNATADRIAKDGTILTQSDIANFTVIYETEPGIASEYIEGIRDYNYHTERFIYPNTPNANQAPVTWNINPYNSTVFRTALNLVEGNTTKTESGKSIIQSIRPTLLTYWNHNPDCSNVITRQQYPDQCESLNRMDVPKILTCWTQMRTAQAGQCYTFGGVTTSLSRAVGIPSRMLTTTNSGHDDITIHGIITARDGIHTRTVYPFNDDPYPAKEWWNYHVWNEMWDTDRYALDATYQVGPSKITDIRSSASVHDSGFTDEGFIHDEVNLPTEDIYIDSQGSVHRQTVLDRTASHIWTHDWSTNQRTDILSDYLTPVSGPQPLRFMNMEISEGNLTIETHPPYSLGNNINVSIHVKNNQVQPWDATLTIFVYGEDYMGNLSEVIYTNVSTLSVPPGSALTTEHLIPSGTFTTLGDYRIFVLLNATVDGSKIFLADSTPVYLNGLNTTITYPEIIEVNIPFPVTVSVNNPAPGPVHEISIHSAFSEDYQVSEPSDTIIPVLAPGETQTVTWTVTAPDAISHASTVMISTPDLGVDYVNVFFNVSTPPQLRIEGTSYIDYSGSTGVPFPLLFGVRNFGDEPAENVVVNITVPQNISVSKSQWNAGTIAGGQTKALSTDVTLSVREDYVLDLSATDSVGNTANGIVYTAVPANGISPLPLPGFTNPPTDPDNDDLYEDLNGNSRKDFNDVVLMFNQMQWIAANEPVSAFDFNGNGRIDFNDIVKLFGEI